MKMTENTNHCDELSKKGNIFTGQLAVPPNSSLRRGYR